jgi:hypothetical protein
VELLRRGAQTWEPARTNLTLNSGINSAPANAAVLSFDSPRSLPSASTN